jgi:predicted NBD/HSP70 family sugar kinase
MRTDPVINGSDVSTLRAFNIRTVLGLLRPGGVHAVSAISGSTGLSRPTVEAVLDELIAHDLVEEAAVSRNGSVGRPARQYRFRSEAGCIAAVDAGPHGLIAVLSDLSGERLGTIDRQAELEDADRALAALVEALQELLAGASMTADDLRILTLGVPGVVDSSGTLWTSAVVPSWIDVDLTGALRDRYARARVIVENDTNLAAIAEHAVGTVAGATNLVCLLVGHRVGAGLIVNDDLLRGRRGAAAEIGALEVLGWAHATERLSQAVPGATVEEIFRDPSPAAKAAVEQFADDLALGAAALVLALGPDAVIVGGGISAAGETFLSRMRESLAERCLYEPTVVRATHGRQAVVEGAQIVSLRALAERLTDSLDRIG